MSSAKTTGAVLVGAAVAGFLATAIAATYPTGHAKAMQAPEAGLMAANNR